MVSRLSVLFTIALSLALPALAVPVAQVPRRITFADTVIPSQGGTFNQFLAKPAPAPEPIVGGESSSSAQAQPSTQPPAVLPRKITFADTVIPSQGGTFNQFLAKPAPAPEPIVGGESSSSAQAQPSTKPPAVLPRKVTFADTVIPSQGGTFNQFLAKPAPAPEPIVGGESSSSA